MNKKFIIIYIVLLLVCISTYLFTCNNYKYYKKDIAKVISVDNKYESTSDVTFGYKDNYYNQIIKLEVLNNDHKGEILEIVNTYDDGLAYYDKYSINDIVFLDINYTSSNKIHATIDGIKRDKYFVLITIIFILTIILVGRFKGLLSIISLISNILIFVIGVYMNAKGINLVLITSLSCILFSTIGLILASGRNKCTLAAIISCLTGLTVTVLISVIVMILTQYKGVRFDQMELLTRPYKTMFISEIMIGGLGAIMDISITITSSFKELINKNNKISKKELMKSGIEIGKDVTGTMINVLFFTYICSLIPTLSILFRNGIPLSELTTEYISLEMVRALCGAIGITVTIPISIFISTYILRRDSK